MKNNNDVNFDNVYYNALNEYLLPNEVYYLLRMENADKNFIPKRNNDIKYLNIAINFVKAMNINHQLNDLSEPFLMQLADMDTESVVKLLNICYFPYNIKNKDYLSCFKEFYDFFKNPDINYGEHKFEYVKNYLIYNNNLSVFYKTLMAIDLNLLTNDTNEIELLMEKANIQDLENYFIDKKINLDHFNKRTFVNQLKYINKLYKDEKKKTL